MKYYKNLLGSRTYYKWNEGYFLITLT